MQINPASLMSTLRLLDDAALKQYGELHKDDPYVLPLVLGEYNARSQVRSAAQAQPTTPQAPVNEQMLGEMGGTGIAAIAPDSVAEMASGGIVGYANAGEVRSPYRTRGQDQWEQIKRAATNAGNAFLDYGPLGIASGTGHVVGDAARSASDWLANVDLKAGPKNTFITDANIDYSRPAVYAGRGEWEKYAQQQREAEMQDFSRMASTERDALAAKYPVPPASTPPANVGRSVNAAAGLPAVAGAAPGATRAAPGISGVPGAVRAAPGAAGAAPAAGGLQGYMDMLRKAAGVDQYGEQMRADQEKINAATVADAEASQKELEADIAARGKLGEGTEARNKKRDEELVAEKDRAPYEALLEAGLAMMAGESPHAFVNIGKGAMEGTKAYRAKVEKISAARDKLNESMDNLETARRAENIGTATERRAAAAAVRQARIQGTQAMQAINNALGFGLSKDLAPKAFDAVQSDKDRATRLQEARIAASGREATAGNAALAAQAKAIESEITQYETRRSELNRDTSVQGRAERKQEIAQLDAAIEQARARYNALMTGNVSVVRKLPSK